MVLQISRKNKKILIKVAWFEYKINKIFESLCSCHDAEVDKSVFFFHISGLGEPSLRHLVSHRGKNVLEKILPLLQLKCRVRLLPMDGFME